mgnify:CR=1 FL=1|tara:strand:- start:693 stop:1106 length:414 start_codon:yes stop_codon:yes gene_type:complete
MDLTIEEDTRAKLSLDFDDTDDFQEQSREEIDRKVREISEKSGFLSKAPVQPPKIIPMPEQPLYHSDTQAHSETTERSMRPRRTRGRTGRTYPFNTKIRPETYDMICNMADNATDQEGRPVSLAEIIERAMDALSEK